MDGGTYRKNFKELGFISKGRYGAAYKVEHYLDGVEYCIKKIEIEFKNKANIGKYVQEVKIIAKLDHSNVITYKTSWIELVERPDNKTNNDSQEESDEESHSTTSRDPVGKKNYNNKFLSNESRNESQEESDEESLSTTSRDSDGKENNNNKFLSNESRNESQEESDEESLSTTSRDSDGKENNNNKFLSNESINDSSDEESYSKSCRGPDGWENNNKKFLSSETRNNSREKSDEESLSIIFGDPERKENIFNYVAIFIQTNLCDQTLRQWLDEQNNEPSTSAHSNCQQPRSLNIMLDIFTQIVCAIVYLHSQDIRHHDLNPKNIFLTTIANKKKAQVADFGMACQFQQTHKGRGTRPYIAPELENGECNLKSDMYSLGIILLEMVHPFGSSYEKSKTIETFKMGEIPAQICTKYPEIALIIRRLLQNDPNRRMKASQLLSRLHYLELTDDDCQ